MSDNHILLAEHLRNGGYSVTMARQLVFDALEQQEPQTISEITTKLKDKIDRASIYRTVTLFEKLGVIQRLQFGWKYKLELSDKFSYHHHHISCTNCHQVFPLREDRTLEAAMQSLAQEYGFKPSSHQIEIQGLCNRCQQAKS